MNLVEWVTENRASFLGVVLKDEPLSKHTYYRIGGAADYVVVPTCEADLQWIHRCIRETTPPFFIMGFGSNVLASDLGFRGLVIKTTKISNLIDVISQEQDRICIRVGASVAISTFLNRASQEGWKNLDFMVGIPGTIGGAVYMNAGTFKGETGSFLGSVEVYDFVSGNKKSIEKNLLRYSYRKNHFLKEPEAVISADFIVEQGDAKVIQNEIDVLLKRRKAAQPIDKPSCGSVFKNPEGQHAWQVVEKLGLRGLKSGDAQISEKHANFIVNNGNAKASDVQFLIDTIKKAAKEKLNIELEEEVRYLGENIITNKKLR